jgi:hypothetical protein
MNKIRSIQSELDKECKWGFWIYEYFLRIHNSIQSDYITSVYRRETVSVVIRGAAPTKHKRR